MAYFTPFESNCVNGILIKSVNCALVRVGTGDCVGMTAGGVVYCKGASVVGVDIGVPTRPCCTCIDAGTGCCAGCTGGGTIGGGGTTTLVVVEIGMCSA